ncbi:MAG: HAD hydrolase-like protein, partial [Candidatus Omnitrophica bacterium]|nr:HAD hydrolase-like protein [Candidatus Omnitrophota bacterium]
MSDVESINAALDRINNSIEFILEYRKRMENQPADKEIEKLLPVNFATMTDAEIAVAISGAQRHALNRAILTKLYPNEIPGRQKIALMSNAGEEESAGFNWRLEEALRQDPELILKIMAAVYGEGELMAIGLGKLTNVPGTSARGLADLIKADLFNRQYPYENIDQIVFQEIWREPFKTNYLVGIKTKSGVILDNLPVVVKVTEGLNYAPVQMSDDEFKKSIQILVENKLHQSVGFNQRVDSELGSYLIIGEDFLPEASLEQNVKDNLNLYRQHMLGLAELNEKNWLIARQALTIFIRIWELWRAGEPVETNKGSRAIRIPVLRSIIRDKIVTPLLQEESVNVGQLIVIFWNMELFSSKNIRGRLIGQAFVKVFGGEKARIVLGAATGMLKEKRDVVERDIESSRIKGNYESRLPFHNNLYAEIVDQLDGFVKYELVLEELVDLLGQERKLGDQEFDIRNEVKNILGRSEQALIESFGQTLKHFQAHVHSNEELLRRYRKTFNFINGKLPVYEDNDFWSKKLNGQSQTIEVVWANLRRLLPESPDSASSSGVTLFSDGAKLVEIGQAILRRLAVYMIDSTKILKAERPDLQDVVNDKEDMSVSSPAMQIVDDPQQLVRFVAQGEEGLITVARDFYERTQNTSADKLVFGFELNAVQEKYRLYRNNHSPLALGTVLLVHELYVRFKQLWDFEQLTEDEQKMIVAYSDPRFFAGSYNAVMLFGRTSAVPWVIKHVTHPQYFTYPGLDNAREELIALAKMEGSRLYPIDPFRDIVPDFAHLYQQVLSSANEGSLRRAILFHYSKGELENRQKIGANRRTTYATRDSAITDQESPFYISDDPREQRRNDDESLPVHLQSQFKVRLLWVAEEYLSVLPADALTSKASLDTVLDKLDAALQEFQSTDDIEIRTNLVWLKEKLRALDLSIAAGRELTNSEALSMKQKLINAYADIARSIRTDGSSASSSTVKDGNESIISSIDWYIKISPWMLKITGINFRMASISFVIALMTGLIELLMQGLSFEQFVIPGLSNLNDVARFIFVWSLIAGAVGHYRIMKNAEAMDRLLNHLALLHKQFVLSQSVMSALLRLYGVMRKRQDGYLIGLEAEEKFQTILYRGEFKKLIESVLIQEDTIQWPQEMRLAIDDDIRTSLDLAYLFPLGGKIITHKGYVILLGPSLRIEEQVRQITKLIHNGSLKGAYVHQMTIPGQLPDEFKYAALAMLISSPYRNDWSRPFYQAAWAELAPLIHDGVFTPNSLINLFYDHLAGRTDYLYRMVRIYKEGSDNSHIEEDRLKLELKFYRSLGLALHAKLGNVHLLPAEIQEGLAKLWENFEQRMTNVLNEFDMQEANIIKWFGELRFVSWWELPRKEADYEPIKQMLIRLENLRWKNADLRTVTVNIMFDVVDRYDAIFKRSSDGNSTETSSSIVGALILERSALTHILPGGAWTSQTFLNQYKRNGSLESSSSSPLLSDNENSWNDDPEVGGVFSHNNNNYYVVNKYHRGNARVLVARALKFDPEKMGLANTLEEGLYFVLLDKIDLMFEKITYPLIAGNYAQHSKPGTSLAEYKNFARLYLTPLIRRGSGLSAQNESRWKTKAFISRLRGDNLKLSINHEFAHDAYGVDHILFNKDRHALLKQTSNPIFDYITRKYPQEKQDRQASFLLIVYEVHALLRDLTYRPLLALTFMVEQLLISGAIDLRSDTAKAYLLVLQRLSGADYLSVGREQFVQDLGRYLSRLINDKDATKKIRHAAQQILKQWIPSQKSSDSSSPITRVTDFATQMSNNGEMLIYKNAQVVLLSGGNEVGKSTLAILADRRSSDWQVLSDRATTISLSKSREGLFVFGESMDGVSSLYSRNYGRVHVRPHDGWDFFKIDWILSFNDHFAKDVWPGLNRYKNYNLTQLQASFISVSGHKLSIRNLSELLINIEHRISVGLDMPSSSPAVETFSADRLGGSNAHERDMFNSFLPESFAYPSSPINGTNKPHIIIPGRTAIENIKNHANELFRIKYGTGASERKASFNPGGYYVRRGSQLRSWEEFILAWVKRQVLVDLAVHKLVNKTLTLEDDFVGPQGIESSLYVSQDKLFIHGHVVSRGVLDPIHQNGFLVELVNDKGQFKAGDEVWVEPKPEIYSGEESIVFVHQHYVLLNKLEKNIADWFRRKTNSLIKRYKILHQTVDQKYITGRIGYSRLGLLQSIEDEDYDQAVFVGGVVYQSSREAFDNKLNNASSSVRADLLSGIKVVIFDFSGTTHKGGVQKSARDIAQEYNLDYNRVISWLKESDMAKAFKKEEIDATMYWNFVFEQLTRSLDQSFNARAVLLDIQQKILRSYIPVAGSQDMLANLRRQGYGVAILSNIDRERAHKLQEIFPYLKDLFFMTATDVKALKPAAKAYDEAFALVKARYPYVQLSSEILFVDDDVKNLVYPQSIGWQVIHIKPSEHLPSHPEVLYLLNRSASSAIDVNDNGFGTGYTSSPALGKRNLSSEENLRTLLYLFLIILEAKSRSRYGSSPVRPRKENPQFYRVPDDKPTAEELTKFYVKWHGTIKAAEGGFYSLKFLKREKNDLGDHDVEFVRNNAKSIAASMKYFIGRRDEFLKSGIEDLRNLSYHLGLLIGKSKSYLADPPKNGSESVLGEMIQEIKALQKSALDWDAEIHTLLRLIQQRPAKVRPGKSSSRNGSSSPVNGSGHQWQVGDKVRMRNTTNVSPARREGILSNILKVSQGGLIAVVRLKYGIRQFNVSGLSELSEILEFIGRNNNLTKEKQDQKKVDKKIVTLTAALLANKKYDYVTVTWQDVL